MSTSPRTLAQKVWERHVDDLRSKLGSSGARHIRSPYFRRLATNDTGSDSVYRLSQLCGPSRTSLVPDCCPTP